MIIENKVLDAAYTNAKVRPADFNRVRLRGTPAVFFPLCFSVSTDMMKILTDALGNKYNLRIEICKTPSGLSRICPVCSRFESGDLSLIEG